VTKNFNDVFDSQNYVVGFAFINVRTLEAHTHINTHLSKYTIKMPGKVLICFIHILPNLQITNPIQKQNRISTIAF
jgi:hypothetical protein